MAARTVFFNLPTGNTSATLLDQMFADFANWIVMPCSATGTNNLLLTPMNFIPTLTAYAYQNVFSFVAAGTSTGLIFAQVGTLPQLPVYLNDGITQASSGKIVIGQPYWLQYNASLNLGAGGFFLLNLAISPAPTSLYSPSFATGVRITNGASGDVQWNVVANTATISNAAGTGNIQRNNISVFGNTGTSGLNGLDTGTLSANKWYYVWLIDNGTVPGVLLSLSSATPVLPTGYVYAMRVGAMFIDSGLKLLKTLQVGNRATYLVIPATNTPALPQIAIGAAGNPAVPTWVGLQVRGGTTATSQYVPPTAGSLRLAYVAGGQSTLIVAPNNHYGTALSANLPPISVLYGGSGSVSIGGNTDIVLESNNIYWAGSGAGSASNALYALGWIDSAAVC